MNLSLTNEKINGQIDLLPSPLYFLYTKVLAYKNAIKDESIDISIQGDTREAEEYILHRSKKITITEDNAYDTHPLSVKFVFYVRKKIYFCYSSI